MPVFGYPWDINGRVRVRGYQNFRTERKIASFRSAVSFGRQVNNMSLRPELHFWI